MISFIDFMVSCHQLIAITQITSDFSYIPPVSKLTSDLFILDRKMSLSLYFLNIYQRISKFQIHIL